MLTLDQFINGVVFVDSEGNRIEVPDTVKNLLAVVDFARKNGFPNARPLIWEAEEREFGYTDLSDLVDYDWPTCLAFGLTDLDDEPVNIVPAFVFEEEE